MQEIGSISKEHELDINAIPNIMEKYMAFMFGKHLVFIDSMQFMASSLDNLAKNLPAETFKYTSKEFQDEKLVLTAKKGIYQYDYIMDSFVKFDDQRLPPKDAFYSILTDDGITDEQSRQSCSKSLEYFWGENNARVP